MVRTQNISTYRRYRNPSISVRQTVKAGRRLVINSPKRKKRRSIRRFFSKILSIAKLGLFLGAAVCPFTCVFVVGWMLLD